MPYDPEVDHNDEDDRRAEMVVEVSGVALLTLSLVIFVATMLTTKHGTEHFDDENVRQHHKRLRVRKHKDGYYTELGILYEPGPEDDFWAPVQLHLGAS